MGIGKSRQSFDMYKSILDRLYEGVYLVDPQRRIQFWNWGAERITGFSPEYIMGRGCYDNLLQHVSSDGKNLCHNGCPLQATLEDGQEREAMVYLHHRNGHRVAVMVRVLPLVEQGNIVGAAEVFTDDVERFHMREEMAALTTQAREDSLTGLYNRRYGEMFLAARQHELNNVGVPYGIVLLDIDRFKQINDRHGHPQGDRVLQTVARTLKDVSRQSDGVIRWGGEEFLLVLPGVGKNTLTQLAERMRHMVEASTVDVAGKTLRVTVSAGAATAVAGQGEEECIHRADAALYRAKQNGRNQVQIAE